MILVYLGLGLISPDRMTRALGHFSGVLRQVGPALMLVFSLIFLSELLLDRRRIRALFGEGSGATGWVYAILSGMFATGPAVVWFALMGRLRREGMRPALVAAFLYARAIKLPLVPLLIHYFGARYAFVLTTSLVFGAVLGGWFMEWCERFNRTER